MPASSVHEGRNLKRIRETLGIKQEALALKLGQDWNQKKISGLEQRELIDPSILEEIAMALHVTPEVIRNFDEDKAVYNIQITTRELTLEAEQSAIICTMNIAPSIHLKSGWKHWKKTKSFTKDCSLQKKKK